MKYLGSLLVLAVLVATAPAEGLPAAEAPALTPEKLGEMLTDLALEPKDVSLKKTKDVYEIVSEKNGHKIYITVSVGTDQKLVWFELKTSAMPDPNADLGDAWLKLLQANATITPAYFSFNEKDRRIYLLMTVDNVGLTPAAMRTHFDRFDGFARATAADWSPKNFRPVPVALPLSAEGKNLLAKLDGTWLQVGEEIKGNTSAAEDLERAAITYTFGGGKVVMKSAHGANVEAGVWVSPSARPAYLDFYFLASRSVEKGIWKLDGDTLTICTAHHGVERPKEFAAPAGFAGGVRVFKKK